MKEQDYIIKKYNLTVGKRSPIEIPNMGRNQLGELFRELGYKVGVEIGVEEGIYSEILCRGNPKMKLFGVDAWSAYSGYRDHVSQDKLNKFLDTAVNRMEPFNWIPIIGFSQDVVKRFQDRSLDFVYIDANHEFPHVAHDIFEWAKKVRVGGMVAGHDYRKSKRFVTANHVVQVVNAYMEAYRKHPWFLIGTKEQTPGEIRDSARSWFFIQDGKQ